MLSVCVRQECVFQECVCAAPLRIEFELKAIMFVCLFVKSFLYLYTYKPFML